MFKNSALSTDTNSRTPSKIFNNVRVIGSSMLLFTAVKMQQKIKCTLTRPAAATCLYNFGTNRVRQIAKMVSPLWQILVTYRKNKIWLSILPDTTDLSFLPMTPYVSILLDTVDLSLLSEMPYLSIKPDTADLSILSEMTYLSILPDIVDLSILPDTPYLSILPDTPYLYILLDTP